MCGYFLQGNSHTAFRLNVIIFILSNPELSLFL